MAKKLEVWELQTITKSIAELSGLDHWFEPGRPKWHKKIIKQLRKRLRKGA